MGAVLRFIRRAGIERGIFEGRRAWLMLGALAWGLHFLNKAAGRNEVVVYREELLPGESVVLRREATPQRRTRRGGRS